MDNPGGHIVWEETGGGKSVIWSMLALLHLTHHSGSALQCTKSRYFWSTLTSSSPELIYPLHLLHTFPVTFLNWFTWVSLFPLLVRSLGPFYPLLCKMALTDPLRAHRPLSGIPRLHIFSQLPSFTLPPPDAQTIFILHFSAETHSVCASPSHSRICHQKSTNSEVSQQFFPLLRHSSSSWLTFAWMNRNAH